MGDGKFNLVLDEKDWEFMETQIGVIASILEDIEYISDEDGITIYGQGDKKFDILIRFVDDNILVGETGGWFSMIEPWWEVDNKFQTMVEALREVVSLLGDRSRLVQLYEAGILVGTVKEEYLRGKWISGEGKVYLKSSNNDDTVKLKILQNEVVSEDYEYNEMRIYLKQLDEELATETTLRDEINEFKEFRESDHIEVFFHNVLEIDGRIVSFKRTSIASEFSDEIPGEIINRLNSFYSTRLTEADLFMPIFDLIKKIVLSKVNE